MVKPLRELSREQVADLVKLPAHEKCVRIVDEFDEWLAVQVLRLKLAHEDLPRLNDAFRDYFVGTRTQRETPAKRTMLVERDRTHYARSEGDSEHVRIDEPLALDLSVPASYARDLIPALTRLIPAGSQGWYERVQLSIDVPIRLYLRPAQVEQLVEQLSKVGEGSPP